MKPNQGLIGDEVNVVLVDSPTVTMIDCEVQKPHGIGEIETRAGTIGAAVIVQPNGSVRALLDIRHADGTALGAVLKADGLSELIDILNETNVACALAQKAEIERTRQ